jgi:hypothetical protein
MTSIIENKMSIISRVNCPERVYLSSNDDVDLVFDFPTFTYNFFRNKLKTPILNPSKLQLLRASIPNVVGGLSIPDYALLFFYCRTNIATGNTTFHCNRFIPSYLFIPGGHPSYPGVPINRPFQNYVDFTNALNDSAIAADNLATNPTHVAGDITFTYDAVAQKIYFTGNDVNFRYYYVGYENPIATTLAQSVLNGTRPQPYVRGYTLNLRAGFVDPDPDGSVIGSINAGDPIIAESYADLVYSQNVYVRCNIIAGSSLSSGGQHDILACIPINVGQLGVALYQATAVVWNTKLAREIYEIQINLLDDAYQPYPLPNNAICAIELGIKYGDD